MTILAALTEEQYPVFFELAATTYAEENVRGGRWLAADAMALARSETSRLLPSGISTADNFLYSVCSESDQGVVGYLWFAEMQRGSARIAFICQVLIEPSHRRKGHARSALEAVQAIAEKRGLSGLALHVFAHNEAANALYRSLGYRVSSLNLIKSLPQSGT